MSWVLRWEKVAVELVVAIVESGLMERDMWYQNSLNEEEKLKMAWEIIWTGVLRKWFSILISCIPS